MCTTCGCSDDVHATITDMQSGETIFIANANHGHEVDDHHHHGHHSHVHNDHANEHTHAHEHEQEMVVPLALDVLKKNNQLAERNRGWFLGRGILALNLVSSPGAGKTALLVKTIRELGGAFRISVIEGDQETSNDAERIQATGCGTIQINTGAGCHLDAQMIAQALETLQAPPNSVVLIENVGNLVCPALFDLGEYAKVAILSVTEGDDKPIKYPHMFRASDVMILNKIDLLPYVDFDVQRCIDFARRVNPRIQVFQLSATTGEGMAGWREWLAGLVSSRMTLAESK